MHVYPHASNPLPHQMLLSSRAPCFSQKRRISVQFIRKFFLAAFADFISREKTQIRSPTTDISLFANRTEIRNKYPHETKSAFLDWIIYNQALRYICVRKVFRCSHNHLSAIMFYRKPAVFTAKPQCRSLSSCCIIIVTHSKANINYCKMI